MLGHREEEPGLLTNHRCSGSLVCWLEDHMTLAPPRLWLRPPNAQCCAFQETKGSTWQTSEHRMKNRVTQAMLVPLLSQ